MKWITTPCLMLLMLVCASVSNQTLFAQQKEKFNQEMYVTNAGDTLKAGESYRLGNTAGERYTTIPFWNYIAGMPENSGLKLSATYIGITVKIVKFKKYEDVVYALFDIKGATRYGIAVEAAIVKNEFVIPKKS